MKKNQTKKALYHTLFALSIALNITGVALVKNNLKSQNFTRMFKTEKEELEDIYTLIETSENLNDEEKEFLWNENLINHILSYYEESGCLENTVERHQDIDISGLDGLYENAPNTRGYYAGENVLHVKNYEVKNTITSTNAFIVAHEYIHLLQVNSLYYMIDEACADIIAEEFYGLGDTSYIKEKMYTKILMEIIGSEPIWRYNFEWKTTALEDAISPYLEEKDYQELFKILSSNSEEFLTHEERLKSLLKTLYENKYDIPIESDIEINQILKNQNSSRFYFNEEKIAEGIVYSENFIPFEIATFYKYRVINSLSELQEGEIGHLSTNNQLLAIVYVKSEEYFSHTREESIYTYESIDNFLIEEGINYQTYTLDEEGIIYYQAEEISSIFDKFPEQSISLQEPTLSLIRTRKIVSTKIS